MEWDHKRRKEKEVEVEKTIEAHLREIGLDAVRALIIAKECLQTTIRITAPEKEQGFTGLVIMDASGRGGGCSSKAGNIIFNVHALLDAVSGGVFTALAASQEPLALPFAALLLLNSMRKMTKIKLAEADAVVLWAMWQAKGADKHVKTADIKPAVEAHAQKYKRQALSELDIEHALHNLNKIGCIKASESSSQAWWLCESISVSYR